LLLLLFRKGRGGDYCLVEKSKGPITGFRISNLTLRRIARHRRRLSPDFLEDLQRPLWAAG